MDYKNYLYGSIYGVGLHHVHYEIKVIYPTISITQVDPKDVYLSHINKIEEYLYF